MTRPHLAVSSRPSDGLLLAAILTASSIVPLLGLSAYWLHISVIVFIYVALAVGLAIVVGQAGLLDLGYIAFYAAGAYSYALIHLQWPGTPFVISIIAGGAAASALAVLIGWPTIRTRGDYLALVTLGFGEAIRLVIRNSSSVTGGPQGLMGLPGASVGSLSLAGTWPSYYLGLTLAAVTVLLFLRIRESRVGLALASIRDDEDAAASVGVRSVRWKLYAFAAGAFAAGIGGAFFASWQRFVSPESFVLNESILVLSMVVVGGMGRLWPTTLSAALFVVLPELLRGFEEARLLALGIVILAVVWLQRDRERRAVSHVSTASRDIDEWRHLDVGHVAQASPTKTSGIVLEITRLSKSFGGIRAIRDVSCRISTSEVIGVIGANGAGKTTLLRCLSGAEAPDAGRIMFHDVDITRLSQSGRARIGLVCTHQQPRLFASMSVGQNVAVGHMCKREPSLLSPFRRESARMKTLAAGLPLPPPEASPATLTFVERRFTELARALECQPAVLLLDEPFAGVGFEYRKPLGELFRTVATATSTAIVIVEHDVQLLRSIADRLLIFDEGSLVAEGAPDDSSVLTALKQVYAS
jgi:ABC-type branched-subunit amino acid transport system permease subunit/ABC-type branched-subunit amino acid transport system ATPase component